jgi:hypothetical protein
MWFNNRPTASTAPRVLNQRHPETSTVGVNKVFGPFQLGNKTWFTDINENLNPLPK